MEKLFLVVFERQGNDCSDKEFRLCKAANIDDALIIAKKHRDKFYPSWSISIKNVYWDKDNMVYVYSDYK